MNRDVQYPGKRSYCWSGVILIFAFAVWGCRSTSLPAEVSQFSFFYDRLEYTIYSIRPVGGNPANYLLLREDARVVLRAKDDDLDGILDTLLVGDISLEEANAIYARGIAEAVLAGKYQTSEPIRIYVQEQEAGGTYTIQSYKETAGSLYNMFSIQGVERSDIAVFVDFRADGTLDRLESGSADLEKSQALYERMLGEGVDAGKILRDNGAFIVLPANER